MQVFNLTLAPRLALAALSGLLTLPSILIDSALGPELYPPVFSWWIIFHGIFFGGLVMAPFVSSDQLRGWRVAALVVAGVLIYDAAMRIPDLVVLKPMGETGHFLVAGISGAVLVAAAVRYIAPLAVTPAYWGYCIFAGGIGGFIFAHTFAACDWDRCSPAWNLVPYVSGWIVWQVLVCGGIYLGRQRPVGASSDYGLNFR